MIYTGYYAKIPYYKQQGIIPVAISAIIPTNYYGVKYQYIAPNGRDLIALKNGKMTKKQYIKDYIAKLDHLPMTYIYKELLQIEYYSNDIVLCCYEKSNEFCHRHIFANYLNEYIGKEIIKEFIL